MPKSVEVVEKSTTLVPVVDARSPADPLTQDSVASIGMKEQATEPRVSGKQVNQANIVTPTKRPSGNLTMRHRTMKVKKGDKTPYRSNY